MFRRVLVGVVTALLTARMLAPGEDPGMLFNTTGPTNLVLPLLWLLAGVGLVVWRVWSGQGDWRGGWVEAALLTAVVLAFLGAESAVYRHPARLIAWEWLTFFLVVCLVRQLFLAPGDQQALLAVFLAGAASLAAQSIYQGAILHVTPSATFAQPGAFASWLALFLPGMLAAHYICRYGRAHRGQTALTALFAVVGAAAFVVACTFAFRTSDAAPSLLTDTWGATGRMILDRPLFGVGAGDFSRAIPRFQAPGTAFLGADPHNFLLEIAATLGVLALLAVLIALGAFLIRASRWAFQTSAVSIATSEETAESDSTPRIRWEYYIGGMCGLVLGFILSLSARDHAPEEIITEGALSCVRCLIWLTAFILFERVPWTGRVRVGVLAAGVVAMLLVLCVSPGIGLPSVAVALWAAVALGLNGLPQPAYTAINRMGLTRILPLPAMAAIALLYFFNVFIPATSCAALLQTGARDSRIYARETLAKNPNALHSNLPAFLNASPLGQAALADPEDSRPKVLLARWADGLWSTHPVESGLVTASVFYARKAEQLDPQNLEPYDAEYQLRIDFARRLQAAAPLPESGLSAFALGLGYRVFLNETRWPDPEGHAFMDQKQKYRDVQTAPTKMEDVDPSVGLEPAVQYLQAAEVLERFLPNAPNNPALHYALADTLFKAWEDERCREQASKALELDSGSAHSLLTDEQRRRLQVWKELPEPSSPGRAAVNSQG